MIFPHMEYIGNDFDGDITLYFNSIIQFLFIAFFCYSTYFM